MRRRFEGAEHVIELTDRCIFVARKGNGKIVGVCKVEGGRLLYVNQEGGEVQITHPFQAVEFLKSHVLRVASELPPKKAMELMDEVTGWIEKNLGKPAELERA